VSRRIDAKHVYSLGTIVQTASAEHVNQILYNMEEEFVNNADEHVQDLATLGNIIWVNGLIATYRYL